jgi:hypothetical protein
LKKLTFEAVDRCREQCLPPEELLGGRPGARRRRGHLLSANGDDRKIVETDPLIDWAKGGGAAGREHALRIGSWSGALFGLTAVANGMYFVDDANELELLH